MAKPSPPGSGNRKLKSVADEIGIDLFSSPFDHSSVDFLEQMDVPVYKVASFENVDLPLLRKVASTGKPVIMSTGMASLAEIDEAVRTLRDAGCEQLALLKCTSAYPALPESMNLRTIPHLSKAFNVPAGLSDHTLDSAVCNHVGSSRRVYHRKTFYAVAFGAWPGQRIFAGTTGVQANG